MKFFCLPCLALLLGLAIASPLPVVAQSSTAKISIPNPIKCDTASCLVSQVIRTILGVVAVVATGMFVWGGVLMLTSGGNERRVKQAKETLVWAAIGLIVIIVSWTLIRFVLDSLVGRNPNKDVPKTSQSGISRSFVV